MLGRFDGVLVPPKWLSPVSTGFLAEGYKEIDSAELELRNPFIEAKKRTKKQGVLALGGFLNDPVHGCVVR
jgi:hypothetical protein